MGAASSTTAAKNGPTPKNTHIEQYIKDILITLVTDSKLGSQIDNTLLNPKRARFETPFFFLKRIYPSGSSGITLCLGCTSGRNITHSVWITINKAYKPLSPVVSQYKLTNELLNNIYNIRILKGDTSDCLDDEARATTVAGKDIVQIVTNSNSIQGAIPYTNSKRGHFLSGVIDPSFRRGGSRHKSKSKKSKQRRVRTQKRR